MGKVCFRDIEWKDINEGMRAKCVIRDGKQLRLLEIKAGFCEDDWCERGHVGCVLDGELEMKLDDRTVKLSAGDGVFILPGERHRAKALDSNVKLLLVEDIPASAG